MRCKYATFLCGSFQKSIPPTFDKIKQFYRMLGIILKGEKDEMNILSNFADSLTELFQNRDISEISKNTNISIPVIYRYLRKESLPTLHNAIELAKYFECSLDYLFGLTDKKYSLNKSAPSFDIAFQNILKETECTRYQLNKHTKIANQSLDDWYKGKRKPSIPKLIKMSEYFGCSLDKLVGRE